jgi:hypothetical protein
MRIYYLSNYKSYTWVNRVNVSSKRFIYISNHRINFIIMSNHGCFCLLCFLFYSTCF